MKRGKRPWTIKGEEKRCYFCKTFKHFNEFHIDKAEWNGLSQICKTCSKLHNKIRRLRIDKERKGKAKGLNNRIKEDLLLDEIFIKKYGDKEINCPKCGTRTNFYRQRKRKSYIGSACGHNISPLKGTIYSKSCTPLLKWKKAEEILMNDPEYPALQLQVAINVTYKTAWRIKKMILDNIQ